VFRGVQKIRAVNKSGGYKETLYFDREPTPCLFMRPSEEKLLFSSLYEIKKNEAARGASFFFDFAVVLSAA
jgi:hypothetical protein